MLKQSIAAALLAALAATIPLRAEILEQVLVKVNGEIITKTEFEARQVAELRNRPELAKASPASLELQKAIAEVTPDLILSAVDELLLVQRGRSPATRSVTSSSTRSSTTSRNRTIPKTRHDSKRH